MKGIAKKLLITALIGASVLSAPSTVKAEDMRQTYNGTFGTFTEGYVTAKTKYKGADFSYAIYEVDEPVKKLYFKIVNKNTVKLVGHSKNTDYINLDCDYLIYKGVHYKNVIIGSFKNDKKLKSVNFRHVKKVELTKNCFQNCKSLHSISLNGTTKIPDGAFKNCSKLGTFILENGHNLKSIGRSAFEGCKRIQNFQIVSPKYTSYDASIRWLKKHKILVKNNAFKNCTTDMLFITGKVGNYRLGGHADSMFKYEKNWEISGMLGVIPGFEKRK